MMSIVKNLKDPETREEQNLHQFVDASRHVESRVNELSHQHEVRIAKQNERQKQLLIKETSEQTRVK